MSMRPKIDGDVIRCDQIKDKLNLVEDKVLLAPYFRPFKKLRKLAYQLGNKACYKRIDILLEGVDSIGEPMLVSPSELTMQMEQILQDLFLHAEDESLLYLEPQDARLYSAKLDELFGQQVVDAYPSSTYDLEEAAKTLAFARSTSCVYHLMRALETPLRCLWITTQRTNPQPKSWQDYINQIEASAKNPPTPAPPDWPQRKDFYDKAVARVRDVKDLWRNPTMHEVERKYTLEEAKDIKQAVRLLLRHLATHLDEKGVLHFQP